MSVAYMPLGTLDRYPYLLPNLVVAGMALISLPLVLLFLDGPQLPESKTPT